MPDPSLETLIQAYKKLFPKEEFPSDITTDKLYSALSKSMGRKIIFSKVDDAYQIFFEDIPEEKNEINWNRLIGCGP